MNKPLTNLNILTTRSQHQAENLAQSLTALGAKVTNLPILEIKTPEDSAELNALCSALTASDWAIFVSVNAVKKALEFWPKGFQFKKVFAVGPTTANALKANGFKNVIVPLHFNSEGILLLPVLQKIKRQRIIIFCGADSRPLLRTTLHKRGAQVAEAICYQRCLPNISAAELEAIIEQPIDFITCSSNAALRNLYHLFNHHKSWLNSKRLLVATSSMARECQHLGNLAPALVASNATDTALIDALKNWQQGANLMLNKPEKIAT
ncbi:MAG: uroporphyrinogen-III synthase [Gammaproteobacteria bacterium]|nr:uroporphyrinogen-III synthase [Gammaproteobacteria bacterium]